MTPWSLMLCAVTRVTPELAGMRVLRSVTVPFWSMNAWLELSPTITPLVLIPVASASLLPGKWRSVALPLAQSTACALLSVVSTAAPTASPEVLTASAPDVRVLARLGSFVIVPLIHSTASGAWVVVSALPTMVVPVLFTACASASTPFGSSGSTLTVLFWIVKDLVRSPLLPGVWPKPTIRPLSLIDVARVLKKLFASVGNCDRSVGVLLPVGHSSAVNSPVSESPTTWSALLRPWAVANPSPAWLAGGLRISGVLDPAFSRKAEGKLDPFWGSEPMMSPLLLTAKYCEFTVGLSVSLYCGVAACAVPVRAVAARAVPARASAAISGLRARRADARREGNGTCALQSERYLNFYCSTT